MNTTSNLTWFALYTAPRAEKRVEQRLSELGIHTYLPLHRTKRVWSDRIKEVEVPLFNSYIFVACIESQLYNIVQQYGVVRVVYYAGKPAVVRHCEIEAIRQFLLKAENYTLCEGDEVEVVCGSLKHQSGKIKSIQNKYLLLYLEQLNARVCVKKEEVKLKSAPGR